MIVRGKHSTLACAIPKKHLVGFLSDQPSPLLLVMLKLACVAFAPSHGEGRALDGVSSHLSLHRLLHPESQGP